MAKKTTLDVDAVKAFVFISDLKSFTRAAEALRTTQGALSVKLRRLENALGRRLVERTPRHVNLSSEGRMFIHSARDFLQAHERAMANLHTEDSKFRLGVACHVVWPEMPVFLRDLKVMHPALRLEVELDNARSLLGMFDKGALDAVILPQEDDRRVGSRLCAEHFGWYAVPQFQWDRREPLPLASLHPDCGMRDAAAQVLARASMSWNEVFMAGGMSAYVAAVAAGLAVGVFARRVVPPGLVDVGRRFELPDLPSSSLVLHSVLSDARTREILGVIGAAFRPRAGEGALLDAGMKP